MVLDLRVEGLIGARGREGGGLLVFWGGVVAIVWVAVSFAGVLWREDQAAT